MTGEGYVKYAAQHTNAPAIEVPHWAELNEARTKLHKLGLVGITSAGIGFGNLSVRYQGDEFLISGTATGAAEALTPAQYCLVRSFDIGKNQVVSTGPVPASSESMTHGVIYRSCPGANCVIHIHSRPIFDGMLRDKCPASPESAAYGTPEIAFAIGKCAAELGGNEGNGCEGSGCQGSIVLAGHDEGVISYGPTVERAFTLIRELYEKYSE
jgi:ribulose-5-phosphate 4-epimerase/fuculose-1-phosphate aldolase